MKIEKSYGNGWEITQRWYEDHVEGFPPLTGKISAWVSPNDGFNLAATGTLPKAGLTALKAVLAVAETIMEYGYEVTGK